MTEKLPPLGALYAFVSAAKYESFTKAANDLCVTQGAVSKQINLLENHLGLILFERKHQGLVLTKAGREYFTKVKDAFEKIKQATEDLRGKDNRGVLNINILPSLTIEWLSSMLKHSGAKYVINIENGSGYEAVNFNDGSLDIAIRIGKKGKKWQGCIVKNLIEERLLCVASPGYLKKRPPIKSVVDLAKCNLLNNSSRPLLWRDYLRFLGLRKFEISHNTSFEHLFMLSEAAKDGMGLAMIPDFLAQKDLENGSLVIAFKPCFISNYAYQMIYQKANSAKIKDFQEWAEKITTSYTKTTTSSFS